MTPGTDVLVRLAAPGVAAGAVRAVEADRLEPGMALGPHAPLLGDLALEPVRLRAVRRQGGVALADVGATAPRASPASRAGQDAQTAAHAAVGLRLAEERDEPRAAMPTRRGPSSRNSPTPDAGTSRQRDRLAVVQSGSDGAHGRPPTIAAAWSDGVAQRPRHPEAQQRAARPAARTTSDGRRAASAPARRAAPSAGAPQAIAHGVLERADEDDRRRRAGTAPGPRTRRLGGRRAGSGTRS